MDGSSRRILIGVAGHCAFIGLGRTGYADVAHGFFGGANVGYFCKTPRKGIVQDLRPNF